MVEQVKQVEQIERVEQVELWVEFSFVRRCLLVVFQPGKCFVIMPMATNAAKELIFRLIFLRHLRSFSICFVRFSIGFCCCFLGRLLSFLGRLLNFFGCSKFWVEYPFTSLSG
jgi:hypothetical protein